jgi:putative phosphoribosyl transferase
MQLPFAHRRDAGRLLAQQLQREHVEADLVLALPRGGAPVGFEIALALTIPLDVLVVRKLGTPGHEELAMGAVASGGTRVINEDVVEMLGISQQAIESEVARELAEIDRRERAYRDGSEAQPVRGRHALIVDDGLATGASMRVAVATLQQRGPASLAVAVPVAAAETCDELRREVDALTCLATPEPFVAVGLWYRDFRPTTDDEVRDLLRAARNRAVRTAP